MMAKELRRKRARKRRRNDEPFGMTVCKVGSALALLSGVVYMMISYQSVVRYKLQVDDLVHQPFRTTDLRGSSGGESSLDLPPYHGDLLGQGGSSNTPDTNFGQEIARLRREFSERYSSAGRVEARDLLIQSMSGSPAALARKLQRKLTSKKEELLIWIAGSSAAAGYGNLHRQAYGYIFDELLRPVAESIDISLRVNNMAMRELTEFPFAWCLPDHYWTTGIPDVIVSDFGEELSRPHLARMEAFLRFIVALHGDGDWPVIMVFRGVRTDQQWSLIQRYEGLIDALIIPDEFIITEVDDLPLGFERFDQFGAPGPDTLHGHNLSVQQHTFIAWLLALHLVAALELSFLDSDRSANISPASKDLPTPLFFKEQGSDWEQLVSDPKQMLVDRGSLHCRTSYEHSEITIGTASILSRNPKATDPYIHSNLQELIVGETSVPDFEDSIEKLLLPKTADQYGRGWVLDLDSESKRSKLLMKSSGDFLRFRDWKMAYYGVQQSGPLQFFIPSNVDLRDRKAADIFSLLIICESDAIVKSSSCSLHRDATFTVEGQLSQSMLVDTEVVATTAGKRTCVQVNVPPDVLLSTDTQINEARYGIHLSVAVDNPQITWKTGPCSVAHIIWMTASA